MAVLRQSTYFTQEDVETLVRILYTLVEPVTLVRLVNSANAEGFELRQNRFDFLAISVALKVHCTIDIIRICADASKKHCRTFFRRRIC